jgi:hypothetical protein
MRLDDIDKNRSLQPIGYARYKGIPQVSTEKENNKLFGEMVKQINSGFSRCFWPESRCKTKAIRAHSIQNAGVLDLICSNNHVIMPQMQVTIDTGPYVKFKEVGRNEATTFTGLCDDHDCKLFEPIDKTKFDPNNDEQLFLLAYRSVLRELHAKMKAAVNIQKQYSRGVELGRFNPNDSDKPMMMATMAVAEAYSFYRYKFSFDTIYLSKAYGEVEHRVEFFNNLAPSVAVSATYSHIDNIKALDNRLDPKCVSLNVFPSDNGVYVVFSYRKEHQSVVLPHITRILEAEGHYKLYLVSKIILMYCENFVLSPSFYKNIPDSQKDAISEFFAINTMIDKEDREDAKLFLFN